MATTGHYRYQSTSGSPDLADREHPMLAACSEVVTAWTTAVRTPGGLSSPHPGGKKHYQSHLMLVVSTGEGSVSHRPAWKAV